MSTLSITIELDNAAFFDDPMGACAYVLNQALGFIDTVPVGPSGAIRKLLDPNGNVCGEWRTTA